MPPTLGGPTLSCPKPQPGVGAHPSVSYPDRLSARHTRSLVESHPKSGRDRPTVTPIKWTETESKEEIHLCHSHDSRAPSHTYFPLEADVPRYLYKGEKGGDLRPCHHPRTHPRKRTVLSTQPRRVLTHRGPVPTPVLESRNHPRNEEGRFASGTGWDPGESTRNLHNWTP